ncbi:MAG: hypothetical protein EOP54_05410 [Sphingobacteriales bacterium]|nr:MAG: hypothetical protein EOP54_05410 [Sphingobacteriales bacterium]
MQQNDLVNSLSINYSRKVNEKCAAFLQYQRLPIKGWLLVQEEYGMAIEAIGKIEHRNKYNYFDLGISYSILTIKKHQLNTSLGLSIAYGENSYLLNALWTPPTSWEPNGHPFHADYEEKMEAYFGALLSLKYDYFIWKNKINIGADFTARHYLNAFPFQVNYGVHLGYNF